MVTGFKGVFHLRKSLTIPDLKFPQHKMGALSLRVGECPARCRCYRCWWVPEAHGPFPGSVMKPASVLECHSISYLCPGVIFLLSHKEYFCVPAPSENLRLPYVQNPTSICGVLPVPGTQPGDWMPITIPIFMCYRMLLSSISKRFPF